MQHLEVSGALLPLYGSLGVKWLIFNFDLGLKAPLALHPPISPLTSGQRNCASWASQPQQSVTLLPCTGGRTTKSTRLCGGIGQKIYLVVYSTANVSNVKDFNNGYEADRNVEAS